MLCWRTPVKNGQPVFEMQNALCIESDWMLWHSLRKKCITSTSKCLCRFLLHKVTRLALYECINVWLCVHYMNGHYIPAVTNTYKENTDIKMYMQCLIHTLNGTQYKSCYATLKKLSYCWQTCVMFPTKCNALLPDGSTICEIIAIELKSDLGTQGWGNTQGRRKWHHLVGRSWFPILFLQQLWRIVHHL